MLDLTSNKQKIVDCRYSSKPRKAVELYVKVLLLIIFTIGQFFWPSLVIITYHAMQTLRKNTFFINVQNAVIDY